MAILMNDKDIFEKSMELIIIGCESVKDHLRKEGNADLMTDCFSDLDGIKIEAEGWLEKSKLTEQVQEE